MSKYRYPALVIGGGHNGLGVMRNLGRHNIDVYCAVDDKRDFALYSKHCKGYLVTPGVESDPSTLQQLMQAFAHRFSEKIYIHPISDTTVLHLSRIIDDQHHYVASIPNQLAAETLVVKQKFYQSLEEQDVPHPTTFSIDEDDIPKISRNLSFPVFIKPSISPTFFHQFRRKGFVAYNIQELRQYVHLMEEAGFDGVIQEIVLGPPSNLYTLNGYFNKASQLKMLLVRQNVRQLAFFSVPSAEISVSMDRRMRKLREIIVAYLTSLEYHGCFGAEFKCDARDNRFKLLDVNARSTWYTSHNTVCGQNIILASYREAVGEAIESQFAYKSGIYAITIVKDLQSMTAMFRNGTLSWRDLLTSYTKKRHFLVYDPDDPRPFLQRPLIELKKKGAHM